MKIPDRFDRNSIRKKHITLTLKVSDAQNVCSHLGETYSYNTGREDSRLKAHRKLCGLLARAEKINRGEQ